MAAKKRRGRPTVSRLSEDRIVAAALRLSQTRGVDAVTIRTLARSLSVDPMSLYYYFPDRESLLRGALNQAFEPLCKRNPGRGKWRKEAAEMLNAYRRLAAKHLSLALYLISRPGNMPAPLIEFNRQLIETLGGSGADRRRIVRVRDILVDFTHGYLMSEQHLPPPVSAGSERRFRESLEVILESLAQKPA